MKQIHFRCTCCRASVTLNVEHLLDTPLREVLRLISHKMDCHGNSIKMEEVNDNQSPDDRH